MQPAEELKNKIEINFFERPGIKARLLHLKLCG